MRFKSLIFIFFSFLLMPTNAGAQADNGATWPGTSSPATTEKAFLSNENAFLPVEQAYILNADFEKRDNGRQQLRLNWQIAEGYYLYRHSFKFALRHSDNSTQAVTLTANIPAGKAKDDEYFGRVEVYYHSVDITLDDLPDDASLVLTVTSQGCADAGLCYPPYTQYFAINTATNSISATTKPDIQPGTLPGSVTNGSADRQSAQPLPYMLLLAILGGAILNLMPCVFPVLSLKILSFANDNEHNRVVHALVYSCGVVISFIGVAAILISFQAAGKAVGWGFHLQSPWFVAALTYLFFVMGLSLSGFIEPGSGLMNMGNNLANKSGYGGSFFTGVLATVVASPCTAPFMGTALGFAITQPTFIALGVFAALGLGMSLPVLLLSCSPGLLKKIPKPGPWMVHLKELLAFPLYATAIWLCWVVGNQSGVNAMATVLLGCVVITLALWLWRGGLIRRILSASCAALAIMMLSSPLLTPVINTNTSRTTSEWQPYSPQTLSELRKQGKPVFVNITADWCITCLANEKVTLSSEPVKQAFIDSGVAYLKGDWTNHDPVITQLLNQYGRTGIPLYLVYPADNRQDATLLPQILTAETVIAALTMASQ